MTEHENRIAEARRDAVASQVAALGLAVDNGEGQMVIDAAALIRNITAAREELASLKITYYAHAAKVPGLDIGTGSGRNHAVQRREDAQKLARDIADKQQFIDALVAMGQDMIAASEPIPRPSVIEVARPEIPPEVAAGAAELPRRKVPARA